jgi:dihydroorotase
LATNTKRDTISLEKIVEKFCQNPRKILQKNIPCIKEGEVANLCVWDSKQESVFTKESILSKSKNSPFIGETLKGKIYAVFNDKQACFFS